MKKISIILPSRDNIDYLKWCYKSIRQNMNPNHQICFADDASTDGTWDWLVKIQKSDKNITIFRNSNKKRMGLTRLYDKLIREYAIHDYLFVMHADMWVSLDLDKALLSVMDKSKKTVVCATRIEPPLHPAGPEKIIQNCGMEPESFNEDMFTAEVHNTKAKEISPTEGVFAPWLIRRTDLEGVGGHDVLFVPQSKEDSDLFNRLQLNGIKFAQIWDGFVYHLTSRGSRFNPNLTTVGTDSEEWKTTSNRNMKNFIRKWGHMVMHDTMMKPIIPNKYDIGFVIKNCNELSLGILEPWCSDVYVDTDQTSFIQKEQRETPFYLLNKIHDISEEPTNDVVVEIDALQLNQQRFNFLIQLPQILADSAEIGKLEYDIFILKIKSLKHYQDEMIVSGKEYYQDRFRRQIVQVWE